MTEQLYISEAANEAANEAAKELFLTIACLRQKLADKEITQKQFVAGIDNALKAVIDKDKIRFKLSDFSTLVPILFKLSKALSFEEIIDATERIS